MLELTKVSLIISEFVGRFDLGKTCIIKPCRPNNGGEEPPINFDKKCDPDRSEDD